MPVHVGGISRVTDITLGYPEIARRSESQANGHLISRIAEDALPDVGKERRRQPERDIASPVDSERRSFDEEGNRLFWPPRSPPLSPSELPSAPLWCRGACSSVIAHVGLDNTGVARAPSIMFPHLGTYIWDVLLSADPAFTLIVPASSFLARYISRARVGEL